MKHDIQNIEQYLSKVKRAVTETFSLIDAYLDLMRYPPRPAFTSPKQEEELKPIIEERLKRDIEYVDNLYSERFLSGSILQFAYAGIKTFSDKREVPSSYSDITDIKKANQFIIGREIDDLHIGLIVFIGRNQWAYHWDKKLNEPNVSLFKRLATWYSPSSVKYYTNSYYDLDNESVEIFASNLLFLINWHKYEDFEKDMLEMAKEF